MFKQTLITLTTVFLTFVSTASAIELPEHSRLIDAHQQQFHVREMGKKTEKPTIVLLSGPNQHWHSDSGWFSLLQPLLAKEYHVISIDRAGNVWSSFSEQASYQLFARQLPDIFKKLSLNNVILVNFASSNLISAFLGEQLEQMGVVGQLWIDPDILLPHSISLYSGFPASWYKEHINKILPHIADNNWLAKTLKRNNDQIINIKALIPSKYDHLMNWQYFKAVQKQRLAIGNQQTVAIEIANYQADLEQAAKKDLTFNHPISIIDTDFELHDVKPDDENYQNIVAWQQEGSLWAQEISRKTKGIYYPVEQGSHLLMFQKPELIKAALKQLIDQLAQ